LISLLPLVGCSGPFASLLQSWYKNNRVFVKYVIVGVYDNETLDALRDMDFPQNWTFKQVQCFPFFLLDP
jgi:hypothetical protein